MAHHNDLIGHNTSPDRNNQTPHAAEPTRKTLVTRESIILIDCRLLIRPVGFGWYLVIVDFARLTSLTEQILFNILEIMPNGIGQWCATETIDRIDIYAGYFNEEFYCFKVTCRCGKVNRSP